MLFSSSTVNELRRWDLPIMLCYVALYYVYYARLLLVFQSNTHRDFTLLFLLVFIKDILLLWSTFYSLLLLPFFVFLWGLLLLFISRTFFNLKPTKILKKTQENFQRLKFKKHFSIILSCLCLLLH